MGRWLCNGSSGVVLRVLLGFYPQGYPLGGAVHRLYSPELPQVLFRLSRWENLEHAEEV